MPQGSPLQGNKGTAIGATSMTLAFPGAVTGTSLLVATMQTPNTVGGSVSDNVNGSYSTGINHSTGNTADDIAGFFKSGSVSGTPTVTITPGGAGNIGATIEEYAGPYLASPLDQTGATDANGTSITSGSKTNTGANGDLCVSSLSTATKNTTLSNSTSGWTVDQNNTPNATEDAVVASRIQTPAAAFTTTWSTSGAAMDMSVIVMSFKFAALGGGGPLAINPGQTWRRQFWRGLQHPFPTSVPGGGPIVNVVSASDTLAAPSDTATRSLQAFTRTATDSLAALVDAATRAAQNLLRTAADTLSAPSDTATRSAQTSTRTATDAPAAPTDAATRSAQQSTRTATDSLAALADAATRAAQAFLRSAADTLAALTDQAFKAGSHATVTAADTLASLSDTATRASQQSVRSAVDALGGLVDVATRAAQRALRTVADALQALVESATAGRAIPATVTGAVSAVNTLVGAASPAYTLAGTASAAYLVAGAASAAYSVSGAVSAPYTVAGAVFPVPT